jgi:hypothetical protein
MKMKVMKWEGLWCRVGDIRTLKEEERKKWRKERNRGREKGRGRRLCCTISYIKVK